MTKSDEYVTKSGHVLKSGQILTDDDIEELAKEAARGYTTGPCIEWLGIEHGYCGKPGLELRLHDKTLILCVQHRKGWGHGPTRRTTNG